jgi:hypothetical protein
VPYNEACRAGGRGPGIEEFWWLGVAGVSAGEDGAPGTASRSRNRHLCLMWFDVLLVDGRSLLGETYGARRKLLEESVREIPGFVSDIKTSVRYGADLIRVTLSRGHAYLYRWDDILLWV